MAKPARDVTSSSHELGSKLKWNCSTEKVSPELTTYNIKLGWIQGVLIPCLLNIWGVMLFLRIAWVVTQAGIILTLVIICLSSIVCIITTLSLSAICTNGVVQGGGVYYLVSRSLGAEMGASVGIMFAFANAVAASMNTIGFCESLNSLLKEHDIKIIDNGVNDTRIIGLLSLAVLCSICALGMDWETKAQNFLIVAIVVALINYTIGTAIGPRSDAEKGKGFVGINANTAQKNLAPDFRPKDGVPHDFFSVFTIFFPSLTGVQAGANICGDLRDPATAIPKGTFTALAISVTSYLGIAALCGTAAMRDATGSVHATAKEIQACKPNCTYGLHNHYEIMHVMSLWGGLIYLGCWAATLSTALTNLLSVPRLIQALGKDQIYPGLLYFSKPYGRHGEPYRGYVLTLIVSSIFLLIGDLNSIAPLITNFYLASYALINFCTFHANLVRHISWRPTFKCHNKWVSLTGFILCLIMMMLISWVQALITVLIFLALYLIVIYRKPALDWGSSTDAKRYQQLVTALVHMSQQGDSFNAKGYNPQVLVLSGQPRQRPALLNVADLISNFGSFMIAADIDEHELSVKDREFRYAIGKATLRQYRAFYVILDGWEFEPGVRALLQSAGLGRLAPNIMLIGYKNDWNSVQVMETRTYVRVLQLAFDRNIAVTIYRASSTHHDMKIYSRTPPATPQSTRSAPTKSPERTQVLGIMNPDSNSDLPVQGTTSLALRSQLSDSDEDDERSISRGKSNLRTHIRAESITASGANLKENMLDVWWLYDDGGLVILLSYIISKRGLKGNKMTMRIFALAKKSKRIKESYDEIADLLARYRIEYSSLTMLRGITISPQEDSKRFFEGLIQKFVSDSDTSSDVWITKEEITRLSPKTNRHLRLREMLLKYSSAASFIVISLPMPRTGEVSATMYMAWLEALSHGLPPVLFVRGTSTIVLAA